MTFRQERLIFDGGNCIFSKEKLIVTPNGADSITKQVYGGSGYSFMLEEEYLNKIAEEGWVLHTASYAVLGKQEAHYFLFVKE